MRHKIYCDGGGNLTNTYFSYKVFAPGNKAVQHMDRFFLRNLSPEMLPQACSIVDDKGDETNNIAEYAALYYSMLWFMENVGIKPVEIFSDSQLIVRQVMGSYQVKKAHLQPWNYAVKMNRWPALELTHVPREIIVKILGH